MLYVTVVAPPLSIGAVHVNLAVVGVGLVIVRMVGGSAILYVVALTEVLCALSPAAFVTDTL